MLVFVLIVIAGLTAILARRDDRFSACLHEGLNERIGVIGFVGRRRSARERPRSSHAPA